MKNRAFHFEIKDLLTQFVAAFDDVVISRYNKNREARQNIEVRYVFAPKQRVMYDIINGYVVSRSTLIHTLLSQHCCVCQRVKEVAVRRRAAIIPEVDNVDGLPLQ